MFHSHGNRRAVWLGLSVGLLIMASCEWPHYRGGPTLQGENVDSAISVVNVASLAEAWRSTTASATVPSPIVVGGRVYTDRAVYDAAGITNCAGSPVRCAPLWTIPPLALPLASTVEANNIQYVLPKDPTAATLAAYSASGTTNCSGVPLACTPLWTATRGTYPGCCRPNIAGMGTPAVIGSTLYVPDYGEVYAYDAAGVTNCAGTPAVCTPLWSAVSAAGGSVSPITAIAGDLSGQIYVNGGHQPSIGFIGGLYAYDGKGVTNCAGSPRTYCKPLWRGDYGLPTSPDPALNVAWTTPVTNDHKIYAAVASGTIAKVMAFDSTGTTNCSGNPKVCQPLWTAALPPGSDVPSYEVGIAVAGGKLYVPNPGGVQIFDAAGITNCAGLPVVCQPLARFDVGPTPATGAQVTVVNGVAFMGTSNGLFAFDATLTANCTGSPKVCAPMWHVLAGATVRSPTIVNHRLVVTSNGTVVTYTLP